MHDIHPGDPLPDTLSAFLSGSPFAYTVAIAPPGFSSGEHIGPAAISRNNVNALRAGHVEAHSKRLRSTTAFAGTSIRRLPSVRIARRVSYPQTASKNMLSILSPATRQIGMPLGRVVQVAWQALSNLQAHAGGGNHGDPAKYLAG